MNEKVKKFFDIVKTVFFVIGIIATAGGLFFLGRYFNRRGVRDNNDGIDQLRDSIDSLGENNNRLRSAIVSIRKSTRDARSGLGNALAILKKAKARSNMEKP